MTDDEFRAEALLRSQKLLDDSRRRGDSLAEAVRAWLKDGEHGDLCRVGPSLEDALKAYEEAGK